MIVGPAKFFLKITVRCVAPNRGFGNRLLPHGFPVQACLRELMDGWSVPQVTHCGCVRDVTVCYRYATGIFPCAPTGGTIDMNHTKNIGRYLSSCVDRIKRDTRHLAFALLASFVLVSCGGGGGGGGSSGGGSLPIAPMVALTVSQFGSGTVTADQGTLACSNHNCESTYLPGSAVTLTATPGTGWQLDHWTGCDTAINATCKVTLSASRSVQPTFTRPTPPSINADVVVLTSATLDQLVSKENNVLTFTNSAVQLASVNVGNIVISGRGHGFALRVAKKIALTGGNYILDTTPVSLTDIVDEGVLIGNSSGAAPMALSLHQGVRLATPHMLKAGTTSLTLDVNLDEHVRITGKVDIDWNPEFAADIKLLSGLNELKLLLNPTVSPNVTIAWDGIRYEPKDLLFDLGVFELAPIYIQAGPVPVIIVPKVQGYAHFKANAGLKVDFLTSYTVQGSYGVHYLKGAGWSGINSSTSSGSIQADAAAHIEGEFGVGTRATFYVYDVLGPFIQVGPYIKAEGDFAPLPITGVCKRIKADLGVKATAGGEFKLFDWKSSLDFDIIDKLLLSIWDWQSPSCSDQEAPGAPSGLSVATAQAAKLALSWQPSANTADVSYYEIIRGGVRLGQTRSTTFTDTNLLPDTAYCYNVVAVDAAGNHSTPSNNACSRTLPAATAMPTSPVALTGTATSTTSVQLNWAAGSGGSAITGYVVSRDGRAVVSTAQLSTTVLKLQPSTRYCFKVSAYDVSGNTSSASNEVCVTTLPPNLVAWTMRMACVGKPYLITKGIDLNVDDMSNVDIADTATDYGGKALAYHLYGTYSPAAKSISAKISWTFAGSSKARLDEFTANLISNDSGDVPMTQVQVTGCDALIRFTKN